MNFKDIESWRRRLGLFPVPLQGDENGSGSEKFVLLNGFKGSFCLDLESRRTSDVVRSIAWSANVGYYIALGQEELEVWRWDRPDTVEKYIYQSIDEQLEAFHDYLEKNSPDTSLSVVSHGIRVFRSLRTALGKSADGQSALKAFLFLLASACRGGERDSVDFAMWGLDSESSRSASLLNDSDWIALLRELEGGRPIDRLRLHVDLLLRHASGLLFQEAHFEALLPSQDQLRFEFSVPEPAKPTEPGAGAGLHFTPPALARTLVEESLAELDFEPSSRITIFDPACGSGEFLREALRQLRLRNHTGDVSLHGWDISEAACAMARFGLAWDARDDESVSIDIQQRNSLASDHPWPQSIDLVLMNPPFVSWEDMTEEQKVSVRSILGLELQKRPDLSTAFLARSSSVLRSGGVLGTILPASFFGAASASKLRNHLSSRLSARLIARLGSHTLFPGALVDAGLYIAKTENARTSEPIALWSDYRASSTSAALRNLRKARYEGSKTAFPVVKDGFSIYPNPNIGSGLQSWAPRPYRPLQLLRSLGGLPRVRDLFKVRQGTRTGLNRAFILSKEDWESLPCEERPYFRPAVLNQSLQDGVLNYKAYVFFPYGELEISDEAELKRVLKTYSQRILIPERERLLQRASVSERWWDLTRHRTWQIKPVPKIVSSYFGDRGSFAWDSAGDYVVVQGFAWLPRRTSPGVTFSRRHSLAFLAILNSPLFSELLAAVSNHVAGGQWDLSPRFVDEIPFPELNDPQLFSDLEAFGSQIHAGGLAELPKDRYDEVVRAAYFHSEA